MKKRQLQEMAQVLDIQGTFEGNILGYEIDSRKITPGMVFFALKGEKVDGCSFLKEVAFKGALAAVVPKDYQGESFGLSLLRVDNVLESLQLFAKKVFSERKTKVVGVTGSVGKTTTKEFIATLLESNFRVAKTPGNSNSQVSVPLSILNTAGDEEVFVFEMSMSEKGHIKKLVNIAPPDIGVITKIGISHAEFFKDGIEGIAAAKAEIFSHDKTRIAILPGSALRFNAMNQLTKARTLFGCEKEDFDYLFCREKEGLVIKEKQEKSPHFILPFEASHFCENFCAAVVVARKLGLSWEQIQSQIPHLKSFQMRFEKIEKNGITYINDSYNASPESMKAALSNLPNIGSDKKKIAVLGEMRELGSYAVEAHRQVGEFALSHIDYLLCYGKGCLPMVDCFSKEQRPVEFFEDFALLRTRLKELAEAGDLVLLKGANSLKLWQLLDD